MGWRASHWACCLTQMAVWRCSRCVKIEREDLLVVVPSSEGRIRDELSHSVEVGWESVVCFASPRHAAARQERQ